MILAPWVSIISITWSPFLHFSQTSAIYAFLSSAVHAGILCNGEVWIQGIIINGKLAFGPLGYVLACSCQLQMLLTMPQLLWYVVLLLSLIAEPWMLLCIIEVSITQPWI